MNRSANVSVFLVAALALTRTAFGGGHTWRVNEIFSNADGTIQFIEVKEFLGGAGETATAGHNITSNTRSFTIPNNVVPPTSFRHLLLATPAFVGLPGAPTPDYVIPAGSVPFFSIGGDTIRYVPYCAFTFGAGVLPTNGINSIHLTTHEGHAFSTGVNSPTNYAGATGSINVGCLDGDGDGYGNPGSPACPNGSAVDCNDADQDINPGADELCDDGVDNNCDELTDCTDPECDKFSSDCPALSGPALGIMAASVSAVGGAILRRKKRFLQV